MKKLPIGIQTFRKIREEDYVYVDKTKEAYELVNNYTYVFLSRPRMFERFLLINLGIDINAFLFFKQEQTTDSRYYKKIELNECKSELEKVKLNH